LRPPDSPNADNINQWVRNRIKEDEVSKYMVGDEDFIPDTQIRRLLEPAPSPDPSRVREILSKSLYMQSLSPSETAELMRVTDPDILELMRETGLKIKKKVYDNRIVTFAHLYLGNQCVNNCLYCGFQKDNKNIKRVVLTQEEIRKELEILAGKIGHKRLVLVFGEHPDTDIDYIVESIQSIYNIDAGIKSGSGKIRRVSVNASPMSTAELQRLNEAGIATYQVFQETYHRPTYIKLHSQDTPKGHYHWRLYGMHRALEAGIHDVGIGALLGLYDWRYEVLGLIYHALELERNFGIGPHTVSFPRLEPSLNTPFAEDSPYRVSDDDFLKLLTIIRLAIPYTGMVVTAQESVKIQKAAANLGITQQDASTWVGVGAYQESNHWQTGLKRPSVLNDAFGLTDLIRDLTERGTITSFCTQGYRCGRVGKRAQEALKSGEEGKLCKLNAVLTFREWLDDFGHESLKPAAEKLIEKEINEIREKLPHHYPQFIQAYEKVKNGERHIHF
jgi:2-iminoacetate synthase